MTNEARARYNMTKSAIAARWARWRLRTEVIPKKLKTWLGRRLFSFFSAGNSFFKVGYLWTLKYSCTLEGINKDMTIEDRERIVARIQQIMDDYKVVGGAR